MFGSWLVEVGSAGSCPACSCSKVLLGSFAAVVEGSELATADVVAVVNVVVDVRLVVGSVGKPEATSVRVGAALVGPIEHPPAPSISETASVDSAILRLPGNVARRATAASRDEGDRKTKRQSRTEQVNQIATASASHQLARTTPSSGVGGVVSGDTTGALAIRSPRTVAPDKNHRAPPVSFFIICKSK